jgi:hypothetical protein
MSAGAIVGRVFAGLVVLVTGILFVLATWVVLGSRFGPASRDPHGYALVFGTPVAILTGFVTALTLPLVFPRRLWRRAYVIVLSTFVVLVAVLVAALLTA